MTINLRLRGNGETSARCLIDGDEASRPMLSVAPGEHDVEIRLGD